MTGHQGDALAALLARWQARLTEAAERSRQTKSGDLQAAYYYRGVADTYRAALAELRELFASGEPVTPVEPAPAVKFDLLSEAQVQTLLTGIGLFPRRLQRHEDGAFTAIFSRLQPVSAARRRELLLAADPRLRILHEGALPDTGDPYLEFAWVSDG